MSALFSLSSTQTPTHTFLDKKPPLMPRQSTSDVLSFTHIIANRLEPGQNVWNYFSPPPSSPADAPVNTNAPRPSFQSANGLPPLSPAPSIRSGSPTHSPRPSMSLLSSMFSPASPISPRNSSSSGSQSSSRNNSPRHSLALDRAPGHVPSQLSEAPAQDCNTAGGNKTDQSLPPISTSNDTPASSTPLSATSPSTPTPTPVTLTERSTTPTPTAQKRRSLAQSFRNSIMSLSQLLSPVSSLSTSPPSTIPSLPVGPPHYNVLVLGSDSAPLASTIYKMSGVLPGTTKIQHYQEISGFFVAHFRSNETAPEVVRPPSPWRDGVEEVKSRRQSLQEFENVPVVAPSRSSTSSSSSSRNKDGQTETEEDSTETSSREGGSPGCFKEGYDVFNNKTRDLLSSLPRDSGTFTTMEPESETPLASTDLSDESQTSTPPTPTSLSVHAFSIDTAWPVPRTLAQTFWFPHAHGIVYIVDATRKNDPRGMDHLLNARQFLASLVSDPHFKRKDIPVVVFANKAGCDPETCYSLEEITEILGCGDWDIHGTGGVEKDSKTGFKRSRPWCIKSTRTDGEGNGILESVDWLKSQMSEVWA